MNENDSDNDREQANIWWFDNLNIQQDARDEEEAWWAEQQRLQEETDNASA